jgi:hypothetical protein
MTHCRFIRMPLLTALAAVLMIGFGASHAQAQGYEGLVESQPGYDTQQFRGRDGAVDGGGYGGVVGWQGSPSATNPYGTAPATDIYQFVQGSGTSPEDRKEMARQKREADKKARQEETALRNQRAAAELQAKLQKIGEERQKRVLEQHQEIIQRMQQQQRQKQQAR